MVHSTIEPLAKQRARVPRAIIAPMQQFYVRYSILAYPLIRIAAGLLLVPHGAQKLFGWFEGNPERLATIFSKIGFQPGWLWVSVTGSVEFFCGLLIAIGLLTRPAALGATILLIVAVKVQSPNGWFWSGGGIEFPVFWAVVTFAIFLRGGERYSLDSAIGKEF